MTSDRVLRVRQLGRVAYGEANVLQHALHGRSSDDYLLLLEHPHVYTVGVRPSAAGNVLVDPTSVGAEMISVDRGGDVTYHGPGQLVGYPIVTLPEWRGGLRDVVAYVRSLEGVLLAALIDLGIEAELSDGLTGVWVGREKIAAIGVKVSRGRTLHGFALNVDPDLTMFSHIVPCGIADRGVTSIARVLGRTVSMDTVADKVVEHFAGRFSQGLVERQRVASRRLLPLVASMSPPRVDSAITEGSSGNVFERPQWMRVRANLGPDYRALRARMRRLDLHTVCEEAGCPNIYECWADGTATFMILGERCTRSCGFCLVDTRRPDGVDEDEPERVATAVAEMDLKHAVITSVARDDLADGGAGIFAATIRAVRSRTPGARVEVLIPDCKGDLHALETIFDARPDVLNHNLETVARLQRMARPSAGYARSLGILSRSKDAGLVTKSGLILGMGETTEEVRGAMADLKGVGVDILTIGQYLRPSMAHLPVTKWWSPQEFEELKGYASDLGFAHVESGPLVRSSYHARRAVDDALEEVGEVAAVAAGAALGA